MLWGDKPIVVGGIREFSLDASDKRMSFRFTADGTHSVIGFYCNFINITGSPPKIYYYLQKDSNGSPGNMLAWSSVLAANGWKYLNLNATAGYPTVIDGNIYHAVVSATAGWNGSNYRELRWYEVQGDGSA